MLYRTNCVALGALGGIMKRLKSIISRVKYEDSYILLSISRKYEKFCEKIIMGNDNTVAEFLIYEESPAYMNLIKTLDNGSIRHTIKETRKYTEKELGEFEFFVMSLTAPWRKPSCSFGSEFKDCAMYLNEKNSVSELLIPTIRATKYPICMVNPGIVIRSDFLQLLEENSITGYELKEVKDYRSKEVVTKLNQLIVTHQLRAVSDCTVYETRKYEETEVKSINILSEIIYKEEALQGSCDFNISQESYIFRTEGYLVDIPYLIVTRKIRDICKKSKIRTVSFDPVYIEKDGVPARKWDNVNVQSYYIGGTVFDF